MPRRVVKLGGSLLSRPDVWTRLERWLAREPAATVLVVGGGTVVEAIRDLDRVHGLDPVEAHWWCIEIMARQAQLAHRRLTGSRLVEQLHELAEINTPPSLAIFNPFPLLREDDALRNDRLPASWDVTSDSIAARIASRSRADELVLLKSTLPTTDTVDSLAASGFVDAYFPVVARELAAVRVVDLADDAFTERHIVIRS